MSTERAVDGVLDRLSDGQVDALAALCSGRDAPGPGLTQSVIGASPAARTAVEKLAEAWAAEPGLSGSGVALALRVGARERRDARARRARPVWTGPGAEGERRLTAGELHDLVCSARERVLLVSYAAFTLPDLAIDLSAAVERGCTVDVVFETEEDSAGMYSGPATPFGTITGIRRWRWPAANRPTGGAVLHAKLLVVDCARALIGSANLTQRALHANLEAGLLVHDADVARELEAHVRGLITAGTLVAA